MNKSEVLFWGLHVLYLFMLVFTFGYAANEFQCEEKHYQSCQDQKVGAGMMGGVTWPFYWSWELQEGIKDEH